MGIELQTFIPTGEKDTNQLILQRDVTSLEQVRALFDEHHFIISLNEAIDYTGFLNVIRVTKTLKEAPVHHDTECAFNSFYILQKHLPNVIHLHQKSLNSNNPHKSSVDLMDEKKLLKAFEDIQKAIDVIDQSSPLELFKHKIPFWHHDTIFLIYMLVVFAKNKQRKPSIKWNDSAIINIVQKSLSIAKVINISNDAIIKAIKRYPKLSAFENFIQNNTK